MKVCGSCHKELPASAYSKKQWKLKQHQRRCMECIGSERSTTPISLPSLRTSCTDSSSSISSADHQLLLGEDAPSCYICMDEGPDEFGKPLVRDCSCRGSDMGYIHISCIAHYAEQKCKHWDGHDMYKLIVPWKVCANCHQPYQNEPAVDLANEFISYIERAHPDNPGLHVAAFKLKLGALGELIYRQNMSSNPTPNLTEEAIQTANKLLSTITQMKMDNSTKVTVRILQIEAFVYLDLGQISFSEKTNESAKEAVAHFEKCRDLFKKMDPEAPGVAAGIVCAENSIAATMLKYEESKDGCNITLEEKLKHSIRMYRLCIDEYGLEDAETIKVGTNLAIDLRNAKHSIKALQLLAKLASMSTRVHGVDHSLTKRIESTLQQYNLRRVLLKSQGGIWKHYRAIRYEDDGESIIVQGPLSEPRKDEATFSVPSTDILPSLGTPVVCHDLEDDFMSNLNGKVGDLRSWDKETGSYEIHFREKDLWPCSLKPENFRILFNLEDVPER